MGIELSELVYDTMKSGFLEFGWSIPTDVMAQVANKVREAVDNFTDEEIYVEEVTADQDVLDELQNHHERIQGLELMAVDLGGHEERIIELERAVAALSRPKKLRLAKSAREESKEPEDAYQSLSEALGVYEMDRLTVSKWCSECVSDSHDYPDCPPAPDDSLADCLEGQI